MKTNLLLDHFEVTQEIGTYYSVVLKAQTLLEICSFDYRRIEENGGVKKFLGIQRPLNKKRVKEIRNYLSTADATFPTSIVISVDERCASFEEGKLQIKPYEDPVDDQIKIPFRGIATIIDGQHRLKAFEGTQHDWDLSVNIFVGIEEGTQATIFSKVNLAQTKVNKSLVYDLFALDKTRSPEKTSHEIVVALNQMPESPFFEKIKRLGSATEGVFGETLSQATVVKGILPFISKDPMMDRDIGKRIGIWPDRGAQDFERRIFYPFFQDNSDESILKILLNFFVAVRERWPESWDDTGEGAILSRTNGYNGLIRFLRDAYLHVTNKPKVISKDDFLQILQESDLPDRFHKADYPAGSSGASALYRALLESTSVS
ncbi:DGQHR domain-containing protein [Parasphingorhabdus sp.]|uniref:DGQHR domain-containing protein n=1 Tax=Parasphingorhabdus sp. TaxID=2709688 RepID=UPI003D2BF0A1